MSFAIPKQLKDLNALGFDRLLPVELNDLDVDRMMTHILEMAVKGGRTAPSKTDPKDFEGRLLALQQSGHIAGVDGPRGLDVLDGWLRTTVIKMGTAGLRRDIVQMDYLRPLTIASYRAGLPKTRSRNRRADQLTYDSLLAAARRAGRDNPEQAVTALFMQVFGAGVDVDPMPAARPQYDGHTPIDISSLLALRLLEVFPGNAHPGKAKSDIDDGLPGAIAPLGRDLLRLLQLYGPLMPPAECMGQITANLSLRLFQLPLRTAAATRALLAGGSPADLTSDAAANPLEIYCDFTRRRGGPSDELSRQCVQRDLDAMRSFFADRLLLRTLYQILDLIDGGQMVQAMATAEQLPTLAAIRNDPEVVFALRLQLRNIEQALDDSVSGDDGRALINDVRRSSLTAAEQITTVLVDGLRKRGLENQVKWFWSTGGITKPYGLLTGTLKSRASWRYAPSDELLTTLLCLCFTDESGTGTRSTLPIAELLGRLESRFGLLVGRPPHLLDTPDGRAGAAENLEVFTRKLQLLGCFQSLSDDFSAQFVNRPREAVA